MLSMGQPDVKGIYMVDNFMEDSFFFSVFYLNCQLVATCLMGVSSLFMFQKSEIYFGTLYFKCGEILKV